MYSADRSNTFRGAVNASTTERRSTAPRPTPTPPPSVSSARSNRAVLEEQPPRRHKSLFHRRYYSGLENAHVQYTRSPTPLVAWQCRHPWLRLAGTPPVTDTRLDERSPHNDADLPSPPPHLRHPPAKWPGAPSRRDHPPLPRSTGPGAPQESKSAPATSSKLRHNRQSHAPQQGRPYGAAGALPRSVPAECYSCTVCTVLARPSVRGSPHVARPA